MANPRRTSYASNLPISEPFPQFQSPAAAQSTAATLITSAKVFLKKPHAFPFLLSIFLLLTWISLRLQHASGDSAFHRSSAAASYGTSAKDVGGGGGDDGHFRDSDANAVKFSASSSIAMKDKRGWLVNPITLAMDFDIQGGAVSCASIHVGEIQPGKMRGNHRHHTSNETFLIWGANTVFRLENKAAKKGYSEMVISADEVIVGASPRGTAHAMVNIDAERTTYFLGCQDNIVNYNDNTTDFKVWKDL
ncbi:uncharacterized protein LOC127257897 [Andrographis paniculata]|uniref:uncharacterized protein LOC127257897 n=1 Tax=Andrographis paniculata TaxID=175694 RepID=UPI0021E719D9|nr:uncharacterized protein LOC127257897 [Andrographis paniculata]